MDDETRIFRLNRRGEGVTGEGRAFPGALPGELPGEPTSPDRAAPICRYWGECGGCSAQHMGPALYAQWKLDLLDEALAKANVKAEIAPLIDAHGAGRRRAAFHAHFLTHAREDVGFMRARSHDIIDIETCPLFAPELDHAADIARDVAADLRGLAKPLDIQITATLGGLDVDVRGPGKLPDSEMRKLVRTAERRDLARISNHGVALIERRQAEVIFGTAHVTIPPGGFLQATLAGEETLARLAEEAVGKAKRVADLFCGAGAFALRLSAAHDVFAADSDAPAIGALRRAAGAPGQRNVDAIVRDLFRQPLAGQELDRFDAVLFDPPRAGAEAQAKAIAASKVPLAVAISCNVETFARDARILIEGGFRMGPVTPLDQFRFSSHLEIVATFQRPRAKAVRRGVLG